MRKTMACLLILCVAAIPSLCLAQARGFDTPEACAQALFAAIQAQDIEAIDACMAFDELAGNFDIQAQAEEYSMIGGNQSYLPAAGPLAIALNRSLLQSVWYKKLSTVLLGYDDPALVWDYVRGLSLSKQLDEAKYNKLMGIFENEDGFSGYALLTYQGTVTPDQIPSVAEKYSGERNQESLVKARIIWGVEQIQELAIRVTRETDEELLLPLRFVQIGGRWLADPNISSLGTYLMLKEADKMLLPTP